MSEQMKPVSPGPWKADGCKVLNAEDNVVVTARDSVDAAFIVRACNSFYPMLEAVEDAMISCRESEDASALYETLHTLSKAVNDIIRKAEKEGASKRSGR